MSNHEDSPVEGLGSFFDAIYGDATGWAYLPTREMKSDTWKKVFFEWPRQRKGIIQHVLVSTAQGLDSYFAPALFKEPGRPIKENIKGSSVVWAEFDGSAPDKWTPADEGEPGSGGLSGIPGPSVRVQTSTDGHEHVYWRLNEFTEDIDFIEGSNRSITYTLRADTSGWDINQILRPPYTTNYKHNLPVTLVANDDIHYPQQSFSQLKPALKLVSDSIDTDHLPEVEWLIAKYKWDEEHFRLFMNTGVDLTENKKRSEALMRIGYYCAEQGMADEEAYSILSNAADRWGKFSGRLDRKKRLLDIINRARQKHPVALDSLNFQGIIGEEGTTGQQYVYGMQEFLDSEIEVEWAIEGFIERGGMGMVSSGPGVGKTQLSIQLAIACALGKPFFDWHPTKPMKMIFFSLEMGHVGLKIFMEAIAKEYPSPEERALLQENFKVIPLGQALPVDRADSRQFIELMIQEIKPEGIVFDALGKLISGELKEETARKVNEYMGILRNKYELFVWMIHHNVKANADNKKANKLEDVFGSTYITADMTSVFTLWENLEDGSIELNQVKARFTEKAPMKIIRRNENLRFYDATDDIVEHFSGMAGDESGPFGFG
jgi:AAA domain